MTPPWFSSKLRAIFYSYGSHFGTYKLQLWTLRPRLALNPKGQPGKYLRGRQIIS